MKRVVLYILTLVVCNIISARQITNNDELDGKEAFAMQSKSAIKTISVNRSLSKEAALDLFGGVNTAYGMSVTMNVERLSDDFLVRILLEDVEGKKHLVAESYREIASDERNLCYSDYCEETSLLDGVKPVRLHIYTHDANILLESVAISTEGTLPTKDRAAFQTATANIRKQQVQTKIERINAYNEAHHKLWRAGETSLSLMDYETKKVVMGMHDESNLHGLEYYKGGIFEFGDAPEAGIQGNAKNSIAKAPTRNYNVPVTDFDWRNRHGRNWMTSVKDQGETPYCVAFALAGSIEAMANLYYNDVTKMSGLDLSEQQIACCSFTNTNPDSLVGIPSSNAFSYCQNNGVYLEADYPFNEYAPQTCQSNGITPSECVKISGETSVSTGNDDRIKRALIEKGPLNIAISFNHNNMFYQTELWGHAMILTGFGTIYEGMEYIDLPNTNTNPLGVKDTIENGDPRIGETFWIYKNSWGIDFGNQGYAYVIFNNGSFIYFPSAIMTPITTLNLSENDRKCTDNDGDGYYFWGGNNRPASWPSWAPEKKDADDTDPTVGALLDTNLQMEDIVPDHYSTLPLYGNLNSLGAFHFQYVHHHSSLQNGAVLQIDNRVNFYNGATLTLCNGSTLIIKEGGLLNNVILNIESGANIRVEGGGQIKLAQGYSFSPPIGTIVEIINGSIEPYN